MYLLWIIVNILRSIDSHFDLYHSIVIKEVPLDLLISILSTIHKLCWKTSDDSDKIRGSVEITCFSVTNVEVFEYLFPMISYDFEFESMIYL